MRLRKMLKFYCKVFCSSFSLSTLTSRLTIYDDFIEKCYVIFKPIVKRDSLERYYQQKNSLTSFRVKLIKLSKH